VDIRSVIAVLGAIVIIFFLSDVLEVPTVALLAPSRPANMDEYMAARVEPSVVAGRAAIGLVTGLLAGYLVAKIAGRSEMRHALVAAALQTLFMLRGFALDPSAASLPAWTRAVLVMVTALGMIGGAAVRARAARFSPTTEVGS
jgi:hypothetical protein